jgi:enterochelin esterase-like enzyme
MRTRHRTAHLGKRLVLGIAIGLAQAAAAQEPVAQRNAPIEVVPSTDAEAVITSRLHDRTEGVWLDGDVLWCVKKSADGPWQTLGSVAYPLTQVGSTDLWAVGLRWDRWPEAFLRVAFLGSEPPAGPPAYLTWRGDRAPAPADRAEPGKIDSFSLAGPLKGSERSITVVLPPGYEEMDRLPAIVLADGQNAEAWGKVIAALVNEKKCRPVAIVGVHSGKYEGDRSQPYDPDLDVRAREYLEGYDQERFDKHLNWVIDSVLPEVARRHPISLARDDLAVAGFSNGGAFAAAVGLRRSDVFGMALALSVGVSPEIEPRAPDAAMARFYLAAGELEPQFLKHTSLTHDRIKQAGGEAKLESFVAGHDQEMWTLALSRFVPEMFPAE